MKMPPRDIFLAFYFASEALKKQSEITAPVVGDDHHCAYLHGRRLLLRVIDQIAPFVLAVSTGRANFETGGGIREVPVATPTMAEIIMAAEGRRDTDFWPRKSERDRPRGKAQVPLAVEFSEGGDIMVEMIKDEFLKEYIGERKFVFENSSLCTAAVSLVGAAVEESPNDLDFINDALAGKMRRREALPFLAIETPIEETQRGSLIQQLEKIHDDIPLLPIMLLASKSERKILRDENMEIDDFVTLIPMTQEV